MSEVLKAYAAGSFDPAYVLPRLLRTWSEAEAGRTFIQEVDGETVTFGQFDQDVRRWTTALAALGIADGDVVACLMPATADMVRAWMAIAWCGGLELPVNSGYNAEMIDYVLRDSQAKALVVSAQTLPLAAPVIAGLPALRALVLTDAHRCDVTVPTGLAVLDATDLAAAAPAGDAPGPAYWEPASVVYTSGTSGPSKGVVCAWPKFYLDAAVGGLEAALGPADACYCVLPLFHVSGKQAVYHAALSGGRLVLRRSFSASAFLDDIRRYHVTLTCINTTMAQFVLAQPEMPDDASNPLRYAIVAPLNEPARWFARRYGTAVMSFYGQTEGCLPLLTEWNPDSFEVTGRPRPEVEVRIVDDRDEQLRPGQAGELIYRPLHPWTTMLSYFNRPDSTAQAWRNGWFHTGDAFVMDDRGDYRFVDRRSDTIRRRGENVSSLELEAMVRRASGIVDCAAVGVPSPWGEDDIHLFVVQGPASTSTADELCETLSAALPRFMRLAQVHLLAELPRTATGKVAKGALRSQAAAAVSGGSPRAAATAGGPAR
jgi:carnitine-CoA ligase